MERTPVSSSNIASVGYDDGSSTLEIQFRTGKIYQYDHVPRAVYDALMSASSHGVYFNSQVRDSYRTRQVR